MDNSIPGTKIVIKHLGFLITEYNMRFKAQKFDEYIGLHLISYTYSFFNENGCFTIHHLPGRGENAWYVSKTFSEDQDELLEREVIQILYLQGQCWLFRTFIQRTAAAIRYQISNSNEFFGIQVT